jgi:hypothetical protein
MTTMQSRRPFPMPPIRLLFQTMEGTAVTIYDDPCSDPDCFPVFGDFMKALQDPGEKNLKNNEILYTFKA